MSDTESITSVAPLVAFFATFQISGSPFNYQSTHSAHNNFDRLSRVATWPGDSAERANAREGFRDALVQQFNFIYGTDGNDLGAWQNLCQVIGLEPVPETIQECRKLVWDAHVNIIDLIEAANTGRRVKIFASLDELAKYTKRKGRFFPKESAYQGGLLKELLRELINPYFGKRRNGSWRRRMRRARIRAAEASGTAQPSV